MSSAIFEVFATLTKGARAALPFLRAAAETTKTTTEILEEAASLGFKLRRQAGLDIIGTLRNNITAARAIRIANPDIPLNPINYGESIGALKRAFSYTVKATIRNVLTGDVEPVFRTVSSNDALSINEVLADAQKFLEFGACWNGEVLGDVSVVDALRDSSHAPEFDLSEAEKQANQDIIDGNI